MKEAVSVLCRRKKAIARVFIMIVLGGVFAVLVRRPEFESEMKILVTTGRADPVVSADPNSKMALRADVSEAEINSEVELLSSRVLLEQVVLKCNLFQTELPGDRSVAVERALRRLQKAVKISAVRKANVINLRYASNNPQQAAAVLRLIGELYLEAHLRVHHTPGSVAFFRTEAERYQRTLRETRAKLSAFQYSWRVVLLPQQKDNALKTAEEMQRAIEETDALLAETNGRIVNVRQQLPSLSSRITTQRRLSANQYVVERLTTLLTELQNRRAELLTRFIPHDRLVQEVEDKIRNTTAMLERGTKITAVDEATDANPVVLSLQTELAKAEFAHAGLKSRREILIAQSSSRQVRAEALNRLTAQHDELERDLKIAEENYLLYARKQEEARIADSLDERKFANVTIAEPPRAPSLPRNAGRTVSLAVIALIAGFVSVGAAFGLEHIRSCYYSAAELERGAGLRVLATAPLVRRG